MKCRKCNAELIMSNNDDLEDDESEFSSFFTFTCPECQSSVELYNPK